MPTYTIHAAKTNLPKLVARAEAGEEIALARGKEPVAKIVPLPPKPKRVFGRLKGKGASGRSSSSRCPRMSRSSGSERAIAALYTHLPVVGLRRGEAVAARA